MGASVYAHIHSNSMYRQTFIWSVYYTIRPEHPHSPIRQYTQRPWGPRFLSLLQLFIVMGLKASNGSGSINFKFQMCGFVPIFEGIIATEEYDQIIHRIDKLGCF